MGILPAPFLMHQLVFYPEHQRQVSTIQNQCCQPYERSLSCHISFGKLEPLSRHRLLPETNSAIVTGAHQRIACKQIHEKLLEAPKDILLTYQPMRNPPATRQDACYQDTPLV